MRDSPTARYAATLRSRTRCAPTRVSHAVAPASALCGSAPCARQPYGAVHRSVAVAHRCAPTNKRQARHPIGNVRIQSRCAARPRFKSSAIRARCAALGSIPCVPSEVVPQQRASSVLAYPSTMLRALSGHFLWVTFLLGQQKKSDSSGGSRSKRPPRRRHPGRNATTRNRGSGSRPAPG